MKIKISQPKAIIGDIVMVENYRTRKRNATEGGKWEKGEVYHAEYVLKDDASGWWHYTIVLQRHTPSKIDYFKREVGDRSISLYVANEDIELVK